MRPEDIINGNVFVDPSKAVPVDEKKKEEQKPAEEKKQEEKKTEEKKARSTTQYNLFRKLLVANGQKLAKKDIGLAWADANRALSNGKTYWDAWVEEAKASNGYSSGTDAGLIDTMRAQETNTNFQALLKARFGKIAEQRAAEIRNNTTDAENVVTPSTGDDKPIDNDLAKAMGFDGGNGTGGVGGGGTGGAGGNQNGNGFGGAPGQEQLSRGIIRNAGGGRISTEVGEDAAGNDVISSGPQSVNTAQGTLRATKMGMADGDDTKPTPAQNAQSDLIAETWGWVEPGNSNESGPNDPLFKLNKQNDFFRYSDHLAMPRAYESENQPHAIEAQFLNHRGSAQMNTDLKHRVRTLLRDRDAKETSRKRPRSVFDEDLNTHEDPKLLPRPVQATVYENVLDTVRDMLPTQQDSGLFLNERPYRHADGRGTWRHLI